MYCNKAQHDFTEKMGKILRPLWGKSKEQSPMFVCGGEMGMGWSLYISKTFFFKFLILIPVWLAYSVTSQYSDPTILYIVRHS